MLDIGVVIPELAKYGGAERVLIECLARWQDQHRLSVYTTEYDAALLHRHGITDRVRFVKLTRYFDSDQGFVLNGTLLPKIWEQELAEHQVYHTHLWPTHLIDRHPMVWYPHEPPRMLEDLRYSQPPDDSTPGQWLVHCYPKYSYDQLSVTSYEASLSTLAMFNRLGHPERIVANSRHSASYLSRVYSREVSDVVYPGVDIPRFNAGTGQRPYFLTVGQLWPHKRIKLLIEAIQLVGDAQLVVVGQGPDQEKLQRMAEALQVAKRVRFVHDVSDQELWDLYGSCLAVVFAAINEPFGIVPLEALAAGKPLIAVAEGGYTEILSPSCAILVPARPADFAAAMKQLQYDPARASAMGQAGKAIAQEYSWDRTANGIMRIIQETYRNWASLHIGESTCQRENLPLLGAQYYCWYGDGAGGLHWNDDARFGGVTDMPALGYYASSDGDVIAQHLKWMAETGLDFAILNLHVDGGGINELELAAVSRIFSVARQTGSGLRFAIQLCPYDASIQHLLQAMEFIKQQSLRQEYLVFRGKPVLFVFWNGTMDYNRDFMELMGSASEEFVRIACSVRMYSAADEDYRTFKLFHGWSLFSPLEMTDQEGWESLWRQAYRNAAAGQDELRVLTVSPGYDDRHLEDPRRRGNPYRAVSRGQGQTYQRMQEFALSVPAAPDMVIISTFNEFHENTHIEPSSRQGDFYVTSTREFAERLRKRWA